jgi:hypothetical protein
MIQNAMQKQTCTKESYTYATKEFPIDIDNVID